MVNLIIKCCGKNGSVVLIKTTDCFKNYTLGLGKNEFVTKEGFWGMKSLKVKVRVKVKGKGKVRVKGKDAK
jgi:hypothetical protein